METCKTDFYKANCLKVNDVIPVAGDKIPTDSNIHIIEKQHISNSLGKVLAFYVLGRWKRKEKSGFCDSI